VFQETKLAVFVLDKRKKPLVPRSEKRARLLLTRGRAVVYRHYPVVNWTYCQFIRPADGYGLAVAASPVPAFGPTALHCHLPATVASGGF
jgi:hypothetical protein